MSSDTLPTNCLVLSKQGNPAIAAMFAAAAPGDTIDVKLKNGISSIDLVFTVDENLTDRISGQLKDENAEEDYEAGKPGDEPSDVNREAMPADGVGASAMAVMGRPR